ncbi:hypothetical protein [Cryptosporangium phraense]|uniref:hypothetical protein n=1 Tax=Cryptosporangium phraense TaxID=2593070 RepID=UPI00197AC14E|nr:hypothetical protein [Cryptosporangium phraense]
MPTPQELFERYIYAGLTRNAELQAGLFAVDGVYEAPLTPSRAQGRSAIQAHLAALHATLTTTPPPTDIRYVPHQTIDPAIFIAETDAMIGDVPMSLVHIVRTANGEITHLRDYFQ